MLDALLPYLSHIVDVVNPPLLFSLFPRRAMGGRGLGGCEMPLVFVLFCTGALGVASRLSQGLTTGAAELLSYSSLVIILSEASHHGEADSLSHINAHLEAGY